MDEHDGPMDPDIAEKMKRASLLKMQSKRHQLFREKNLEAAKMAEAGRLHAEIADALRDSPDACRAHYTDAAMCLARAKRLCRDILRQRARTED